MWEREEAWAAHEQLKLLCSSIPFCLLRLLSAQVLSSFTIVAAEEKAAAALLYFCFPFLFETTTTNGQLALVVVVVAVIEAHRQSISSAIAHHRHRHQWCTLCLAHLISVHFHCLTDWLSLSQAIDQKELSGLAWPALLLLLLYTWVQELKLKFVLFCLFLSLWLWSIFQWREQLYGTESPSSSFLFGGHLMMMNMIIIIIIVMGGPTQLWWQRRLFGFFLVASSQWHRFDLEFNVVCLDVIFYKDHKWRF